MAESLTPPASTVVPAGNNNIGDVDVASVPAPLSTTGGGTEATALRVTIANDSTGLVSVDDNGGSLTVDGTVAVSGTVTVGSHAVTNAGTFVTQENGAALTSLQLMDDTVYTDDTSTHATGTSKGLGIMAAAVPTDTSVNANDIGMVGMTTDRKLYVSVQDAIPAGNANIGDVDVATLPADPLGANADAVVAAGAAGSLSAKLRRLTTDTDAGNTLTGAVAETAPASDTASSGLNGRLQRIAQNITTLIAKFTVGAGTEAAALRVTLPTDGTGKVNAAQSGTWTVQPGNTANTTAWKVDGSAVTQPVSIATMPVLVAGNANIGDVDVASIAVGENHIGNVGIVQTRISVTPTVSTSPAYTAKDAVGGLLTFANAARTSGGTIILQTVIVIDNSQQMPALDLVLFDRTFTNSTDNAVFAPSDADLANTVGVVAVSNWADFSTNSVATRTGLGHAMKLNGTSLFGQLVTRTTPTFVATSDIVVILEIIQD